MQREGGRRAPTGPPEEQIAAWSGPLVLAALFVALAAWSWDRWADVQIDFGNEAYAAWRLALGDAFHRDVALRSGPLPHVLNAAWFTLFGVSLRTLELCNLAIVAGTLALVWRLLRPACGRLAATLAGATFLAVFAFARTLDVGNYNWVAPYHHSQTHGVALGLALALLAGRALRGGPRTGLAWLGAGLCLGLAFLTQAELFVPAAGVAAVALGLEAGAADARGGAAAARLAVGAALPVAGAFALLGVRMPAREAVAAVLGNWTHLAAALGDPFYRARAGLDAPGRNLLRALGAAAKIGAFALAIAAADRAWGRRIGSWAAALAGALVCALLVALGGRIAWLDLARALPLATAAGAALLVARSWRRRRDRDALAREAPLALFAVLALGLLAKQGLAARFDHYGFALAMPATLLLVAGLVAGVPRRLGASGGALARALAAGAVVAGLVAVWSVSARRYERATVAVGRGADRILAEGGPTSPRAARMAETLARLEGLLPPGATLLVLPEGAFLNYWLRHRNPSRYLLFLPTEIAAWGEAEMLRDLEREPPDFVVLLHRESAEFGVGPFGRDPRNGLALRAWVDAHYERVARIGPEPFGPDGFGALILRRRGEGGEAERR